MSKIQTISRQDTFLFAHNKRYGKLFVVCHKTERHLIEIWVLNEDADCMDRRHPNYFRNGVCVYGVVDHNWIQINGWLHKGPWQEDFKKILEDKRAKEEKAIIAANIHKAYNNSLKDQKEQTILNNYKK